MADYLLFTLYSPFSSWGEIAVGEVRASKTHPGRSAVFGLIAAALGIRRNDDNAIRNLHENYGLGIKAISIGYLTKDFHTIQAARTQKNVVFRKRADELHAAPESIGTLISSREYRADAYYIVSIWKRFEEGKYSLEAIKNALQNPVFVPYLGRKACPPACNFAPEVMIGKNTLKAAFDAYNVKPFYMAYDKMEWNQNHLDRVFKSQTETYYWDDCENSGLSAMLSTERYDTVANAARRQFTSRRENMSLINMGEE